MTSFKTMLSRAALALLGCAGLVALCYFFVDRPVAFFVHDRGLGTSVVLKGMTQTAMVLDYLSPVVIAGALVRLAFGPLTRLERTLFAAALALIVAVAFEYYLKFLFGRTWPDTWVDNNPSLIRNGVYGFFPFHFERAYGSFPSGHTARTVAVMAVVWVAWPGWRWLTVVVPLSVVVGLVGVNYHFVGDTVGGAYLGGVAGAYTARFFGLGSPSGGTTA
jgi:membrane-associated phospholipid phosphatase